jgi:hypothetical protein
MPTLINETYTKICYVCDICKPLHCFYASKSGKNGRHAVCIQCMRASMNKQARNRPASSKAYAWRRKRLLRKYGLHWSEYQALLTAQHHRCAICGRDAVLGVDHDHNTGQVRGLLCNSCNVGIGHFRDSPALLLAASRYLLTQSTTSQE